MTKLNILIKNEFEINKEYLENDFFSDKNKEKRNWFFKTFGENIFKIQDKHFKFCRKNKINILFFTWLETYTKKHNIKYPFKTANPITKRNKKPSWETKDGENIESDHPPLRTIKITIGTENIEPSPYKKPQENDYKFKKYYHSK